MSFKLNESSPLKLLKNLNCTFCNSQFFIKDVTLKGSKCPMLLHCGHSVCESCIQQSVKAMKTVMCLQCGSVSSLESSEPIDECFPVSLYGVGSLLFQHFNQEKKRLAFLTKKDGNFNYSFKQQSDINLKTDSSGVCEECSLSAVWYCENCQSNFCEICWCRVHGSAKSLMKHSRSNIHRVELKRSSLKKCVEHETQNLEFFCKGCSTTICSHCVILRHQGEGHCPITLKEKNIEMINKIKTAAKGAENTCHRMKQTLEKIKLIQSSTYNFSLWSLENEIKKKFSRIHGILQLEEKRLLKQIHEKAKERENRIRALQMQLEKQVKNAEYLLREIEVVVRKPEGSDLTDLHRELEEIQNLPCHLIPPKSGNVEARITFDESLIELLQIYCTIDLPSDEIFELRSSSDLPEDHIVEPLSFCDFEKDLKFIPKESQECSESDMDVLSNNSSRDLSKEESDLPSLKIPKETHVFLENKTYSVRVTYIKNPGEFYVTLNSQRCKQQAIDKKAAQCENGVAVVENFAKGEIYLVKYKVDKKWYRARIIEVLPKKNLDDEVCVLVYYIDYGNSETVPISRLRSIPPDMLEEPPLAVKCKLFDCIPKNGSWCVESTKTMEKILSNYTATMFVMKSLGDCLEVDLSVIYPEGQIGRDIISVRDALLFLEFSSFVQGSKITRNATASKYLQQCLPSVGDTFAVIITHVNSPSDFYVQKTRQDASFLYKLTIDLQNYYSDNLEKGFVYNPAIGMPCAALFSADRRWYRAKIVDIPGKKMVTVFYVDYGNKETVPWTEIRKLKECFVKRPPLALNCAMADIIPTDVMWTKSYLEKCVMKRDCRIYIHGRSKQKLKVLLYKHVNRKEVCLNSFFVNMGYAVKSSPNCTRKFQTVEDGEQKELEVLEGFPLKTDEEKLNNEIDCVQENSNAENNPLSKSGTLKECKRNTFKAKELRELNECEKKKFGEETSSVEDVESEVDEYNNIFKVKVKILLAETPFCIYITFPALMNEFENLQSKLHDFYHNSSPEVKEWKVDGVCAVFNSEKHCWYRGSILSILPNDHVKVFLKDIAQYCTEPVSALRELDSSFMKYATCAVKCHLADIAPPGEQWPSISSEFLVNEFENYKEVYMTKRGHIENRSLPVELWVQKIVPKGALEPIGKEWVTLNQLLVNQGLAIPISPKFWYGSATNNCGVYFNNENDSENDPPANGEDSSDEKGLKVESEVSGTFIPSLSSQWKPSEPLRRSCFVGIPTYVDSNAVIYIYDLEEDGKKLKMIQEALLEQYGNTKLNPEDHFWSPGQLCIARYHLDNSWYRGVILQNNEDLTYDVMFVDYGNVETCQASDLRKRIKTHEIPVLTHKCQLQGINPLSEDNKWPIPVIDNLHALVVDKKCEVNILKAPLDPSETYLISLKLIKEDVEVSTFLVEQGLAVVKCSMSDNISTADSDHFSSNQCISFAPSETEKEVMNNDSEISKYIPLSIPNSCGIFIEVTFLNSETEFFANIVDNESLSADLKKVLKEFDILEQTFTKECHEQPLLDELVKGQTCCSVNSINNKWCRGEIVSFLKKENSVCVFFVDYGNKEYISEDLLHECKKEWMSLPKMALKFNLAEVKKCPNVSKAIYMKTLTSCLKDTVLFADISNNHEVLEVKLYVSENGPLAYQNMIDKKLMTLI